MKQLLFLLVIFFSVGNVSAQKEETLFQKGIRLSGVFGGWNSIYGNTKVDNGLFHGGFVQFEFNKDFNLGIEWMRNGSIFEGTNDYGIKNYDYRNFILGYSPNSYKMVHPTFALTLGTTDISSPSDVYTAFTFGPRVGVELNLARWMRLDVFGGAQFINDARFEDIQVDKNDLNNFYLGGSLKFGFSWGRAKNAKKVSIFGESTNI